MLQFAAWITTRPELQPVFTCDPRKTSVLEDKKTQRLEFFDQSLASGGREGEKYHDARARNVAWAVDQFLAPALSDCDCFLAPSYSPAWKNDLVFRHLVGLDPAIRNRLPDLDKSFQLERQLANVDAIFERVLA